MAALTLNSKQEHKYHENDIFQLLDEGVKVFFIPIGHNCDRQKNLEQLISGFLPSIRVISIHRRLVHEVYCLVQAFKLDCAASEVEGLSNSEDEDELSTAAGHMKCPS